MEALQQCSGRVTPPCARMPTLAHYRCSLLRTCQASATTGGRCAEKSTIHCGLHPAGRAAAVHMRTRQRAGRFTTAAATPVSEGAPSSNVGAIFELDGAVLDVHQDGHRVAFNKAFHSLGMDCVCWSPIVYNDLLACSDGTGEGLVHSYYATVGWPSMMATSDYGAFAKKVHAIKQEQLKKLLLADAVPLRADVKQVITDAVADGAKVALLCGTQSVFAREAADSCLRLLGPELAPRLTTFTFSLEGAQDDGNLSQMLSAAANDLKQRQALNLVSNLQAATSKAQVAAGGTGTPLGIDPSLLAAGGSQQRVSPQYLAALVATLGLAAQRCLVLASGNSLLQAAGSAGTVPIAVPRKFASQGSFPDARAKFGGYGPGFATWPRLKALLQA